MNPVCAVARLLFSVHRPPSTVHLLLLLAIPVAQAEERPAEVDVRVQVRQLLKDLDAPQRTVRTKAQQELLDLGPAILPLLPAPELLPNRSVQETVGKIRVVLERRKALESLEPSRVTLEGVVSLGEVLKRITDQTGNQFDVTGIPAELLTQPVDRHDDQAAFWDVLDDLAAEQKLRLDLQAASTRLRLVPRTAPDRPERVQHAGAFRVAVESATADRLANNGQPRVRLTLGVTPEPRLRTLFLLYAAEDFEIPGWAPFNPEARYELPLGEGGRHVRFQLDFVRAPAKPADSDPTGPAADLPKQLDLTGKFQLQTAAGHEQIRFTDLARSSGASRRRGGVTVTLQRATYRQAAGSTPEQPLQDVSLRVAVQYDTLARAFESHKTWIYHNEVFLEDAAGRRREQTAFDTTAGRDAQVLLDYHFDRVPGRFGDYSFIYVAPTLILDVPVAVDIPDIPVAVKK